MEILCRAGLGEDLLDDMLVVVQNLVQCVSPEVVASLQVQKLAEGEAAQVITVDDAVEFGILVFQPHDAGTGEDNPQVGVVVVTLPQFLAPVGLLEDLVNEQDPSPVAVELTGKVGDATPLEVEVVHVDVETLAVSDTEVLLGVLQQEGCLTHTASALDANQAVVPVYLIHEGSTNWRVNVFHQIRMRAEESVHWVFFCLFLQR